MVPFASASIYTSMTILQILIWPILHLQWSIYVCDHAPCTDVVLLVSVLTRMCIRSHLQSCYGSLHKHLSVCAFDHSSNLTMVMLLSALIHMHMWLPFQSSYGYLHILISNDIFPCLLCYHGLCPFILIPSDVYSCFTISLWSVPSLLIY